MHNTVIFSLDLGTSSVGWSVIKDGKPVDAGVRIFPEGMDRRKGEKSLNQDRRDARSIRRQGYRRIRRKRKVEFALQELGLLPSDLNIREALLNHPEHNPYQLRTFALDERLEPYQLGRALYHLAQRRGYLSNRKTGTDEDGVVKAGISSLEKEIADNHYRTLGEYFYKQNSEKGRRIRSQFTSRQMYIDEFNAIWNAQAQYHQGLNAANKQQLFNAIFYQRPLKIQSWLLGKCELEPDRKRAYAATLAAQEFRIWQNINNIKVQRQVGEVVTLNEEQRATLYDLLAVKKVVSWKTIKSKLGFLEGDVFNLEKSKPSGLQGNVTASIIYKVLGKQWLAYSEKQQEQLVFDLLNIEDELSLVRRLERHWHMAREMSRELTDESLALPKGTMSLSHKAIRNLLPHLQKGLLYSDAIKAAGYLPENRQSNEVSTLPLFTKNLRNPMVERALFQVRRVVNSLLGKYGKPNIIRVELVRDLKNNAKKRAQYEKQQRINEKQNQEADAFFAEHRQLGIVAPKRQDRLKYRLWKECGGLCPFSGRPISPEQLFVTGEVEVEHIIPYSRSLDDSYMNKTLCFREDNQFKDNRTPYEAWGKTPRYEQVILQAIKAFPRLKRERFNANVDKFTDDFISQQLNETGYIARETKKYLEQLGCAIEPVKGGVTAKLRWAWGLNSVLSQDALKNREDHRHHAIDAIVLGYADRKAVKRINDHSRRSESGHFKLDNYPLPYPEFRQDVIPLVNNIVVSFKRSHKVKGALHDSTLYGVAKKDEEGNVSEIVIRKPLTDLKPKDLANIRDKKVREMAQQHLAKKGSIQAAFGDEQSPFGFHTRNNNFVPIRSVRITYSLKVKPVGKGKRQRYVKTGSNHHIAIYEQKKPNGNMRWQGDVESTLNARIKQSANASTELEHKLDGKFVMKLHINDMLIMEHGGITDVFRVQKIAQGGTITLRHHADARKEKGPANGEINKTAESLRKSNASIIYPNVLGRFKDDQKSH